VISRVGTGNSGEPLVLAELEPGEKEALYFMLRLLDEHIGEIQTLRSRRRLAQKLARELREAFGIPAEGEGRQR
jgi:hypothetical protein